MPSSSRLKLLLPIPGRVQNGCEIIIARLPIELLTNLITSGNQFGRITCATSDLLDREIDAADLLGHSDDITDRETVTVATVEY